MVLMIKFMLCSTIQQKKKEKIKLLYSLNLSWHSSRIRSIAISKNKKLMVALIDDDAEGSMMTVYSLKKNQ